MSSFPSASEPSECYLAIHLEQYFEHDCSNPDLSFYFILEGPPFFQARESDLDSLDRPRSPLIP
jgi:hypothetical protein